MGMLLSQLLLHRDVYWPNSIVLVKAPVVVLSLSLLAQTEILCWKHRTISEH